MLKPCIPVVNILKMCFLMELDLILTELQPFELSHLFSMHYFETMQTCCGCIEDVHVNICIPKIIIDKITACST